MKLETRNIKRGFTLLELIVVSGLIALGASIVLANTPQARVKARDNRRVADLQQIQKALELYRTEFGSYPDELSDLAPAHIPEIVNDPQGNAYKYTAGCNSYHLGAILEDETARHLGVDADAPACGGSDFHGATPACSGAAAVSPDKCFDIKP